MDRQTSRQVKRFGLFLAGGLGFLVLIFVAIYVLRATSGTGTVEATPTSFPNEDWIFSCRVTGKGTANADEGFSGPALEGYARNRGGQYVERVYPGTRVQVVVWVTKGSVVKPGQYKLYGTVVQVDLHDRRAVLTDCVFVQH